MVYGTPPLLQRSFRQEQEVPDMSIPFLLKANFLHPSTAELKRPDPPNILSSTRSQSRCILSSPVILKIYNTSVKAEECPHFLVTKVKLKNLQKSLEFYGNFLQFDSIFIWQSGYHQNGFWYIFWVLFPFQADISTDHRRHLTTYFYIAPHWYSNIVTRLLPSCKHLLKVPKTALMLKQKSQAVYSCCEENCDWLTYINFSAIKKITSMYFYKRIANQVSRKLKTLPVLIVRHLSMAI